MLKLLLLLTSYGYSQKGKGNGPAYKVKHTVQGYLGASHLANLVYRKGKDGDKFVGWGRTPITEWPVGSANRKQVVPSDPDKRYSNGGCAFDVDGDGIDEIITAFGAMSNLNNASLIWLKEVEGEKYWREYTIASIWPKGYTAPHDILPYTKQTAAGGEFKAVIANKARNELHLFVVPENPVEQWPHYKIGTFPNKDQSGMELADINGDGNIDLVSGNFWIEAPEDPTDVPWTFHRFNEWDKRGENRWGGMNKHGVADFDGDGLPDVVATEAEIPGARLSLFLRKEENATGLWKEVPLDKGLYAPHSLVVTDLDGDSKPDFVVGEMTAGGWDFTYNPNPKIYAYINQGNQKFKKHHLYEGWGVHEMRIFPKLYQGKIMVYAADEIQPQKFNDMNTHVSYWLISLD